METTNAKNKTARAKAVDSMVSRLYILKCWNPSDMDLSEVMSESHAVKALGNEDYWDGKRLTRFWNEIRNRMGGK